MASALCTKCGAYFQWSARRGSRLADVSSPCCHTPARAFRNNERLTMRCDVQATMPGRIPFGYTHIDTVAILKDGNIQTDGYGCILAPAQIEADADGARWRRFHRPDAATAARDIRIPEATYQELLALIAR